MDPRLPEPALACPVCATTGEPLAQVGSVAVCRACGSSLVVDATGIRRATAADTTTLALEDLQTLRRARGKIARAGR